MRSGGPERSRRLGLGVLDGAKGKSPGQGSTQNPSERGLVAGQKFFHGGSLANRLLR